MDKKKYTILIADDEYWTREKLRHMIRWEEYMLEFLEPAADGEDALRKIEENRPDILITDINMPFVGGVDLLQTVQKRYPDIVTFVISGYDDFDYVKGTFMSGAINCLIKPIAKIDLVNAVTKALEIIAEHESERLELLKAASVMQDREFSQILQQNETLIMPSAPEGGFPEFTSMSLMLVKIHNFPKIVRARGGDIDLLAYRIKKEMKKIFGKEDMIVFNYIYRLNEFIVVTEKFGKELLELAEKTKARLSVTIQSCVTICVSGHSYSLENLHKAYVEAVGLLMTRGYDKKDEVLSSRGDSHGGDKVKCHFTHDHEKQLKSALRAGKMETVREVIFEKAGLRSCAKNRWSYLEVKQTVRQILNLMLDHSVQSKGYLKAGDMESVAESVEKITENLDTAALCEAFEEMIEYCTPERKETVTDTMRGIVRQAAEWIDGHYSEELSLGSLAEQYHVESSYFSKVFRQEIGENLIFYITNKRIEKAKEYVKNTEMNLAEVAFLVGYDDYTYFSRVFKKNTGMSPREYRSFCEEELS